MSTKIKKKNEKFTLVLAGGSALGFAHIGTIKNLNKNKQTPNEIIGTSMGALIGAFLAKGYNYEQIYQTIAELKYLKIIKTSIFNKTGILKYDKIKKFLEEKLGNIKISELKIKLKLIATNQKTGEIKIFEKNDNLIDAICSSIAIPGIFQPYQINKEKYCDGFLTSNLPFEYAKNKKIIAINVISNNYIKNFKTTSKSKILQKTVLIHLKTQTDQKIKTNKNKNLKIIEINLKNYNQIDFHKWKEIIKLGEKQTKNNF